MREAETESHEGKRKTETLWPIFKIHHQKARYIYDLFYRRKAISRELYEFCIKASWLSVKTRNKYCFLFELSWGKLIIDLQEKIADGNLIAKWKKQGYENLCCLRCIQTRDTNFATNCICRWKFLLLIQYRTSICAVAGCPRGNWRRERSWSVFTVAAEDVLDKSKSHWKFLIK